MSNKEKKPFKETKFGVFINKVKDVGLSGINLKEVVGKAASGNIVGAIASVGKSLIGSKHEKAQELLAELMAQQENYLKELEMIYKDKEGARDMQKVALEQDDLFSKRFIYYFALCIFGFSALIILLLFFVQIPSDNQRIIDMAIGILIGTGLVGVIQFFYGSSEGSKTKGEIIRKIKN
tara:strand:+ start:312 stop:848 length:537 start_codon:yes stop_codon:yes gene_type:complete